MAYWAVDCHRKHVMRLWSDYEALKRGAMPPSKRVVRGKQGRQRESRTQMHAESRVRAETTTCQVLGRHERALQTPERLQPAVGATLWS